MVKIFKVQKMSTYLFVGNEGVFSFTGHAKTEAVLYCAVTKQHKRIQGCQKFSRSKFESKKQSILSFVLVLAHSRALKAHVTYRMHLKTVLVLLAVETTTPETVFNTSNMLCPKVLDVFGQTFCKHLNIPFKAATSPPESSFPQ